MKTAFITAHMPVQFGRPISVLFLLTDGNLYAAKYDLAAVTQVATWPPAVFERRQRKVGSEPVSFVRVLRQQLLNRMIDKGPAIDRVSHRDWGILLDKLSHYQHMLEEGQDVPDQISMNTLVKPHDRPTVQQLQKETGRG